MSLYLGTTPIADTGSSKATTSLSNLTSAGANIANWSNNVTNCITSIPQDIKLELNSGTLTLKAGSKVYVPNGFEADGTTPKFDVINITSDISTNYAGYPDYDNVFICLKTDGSFATYFKAGNQISGSSGVAYSFTYRTDLNKIYDYEESTTNPYEQVSFPIGRFKYQNNGIVVIYQVFNGFGYIGSTVFALPGVKGLIPNGRNADGTLKNIEFTVNSVLTRDTGTAVVTDRDLLLNATYIGFTECTYNEADNLLYNPDGDVVIAIEAGKITTDGSKITSLTPKTVFHALDYNDSSTISGWSMPGDRYVDLTLGASGSTYTAPANGFVTISKSTNGTNQYLYIHGKLWVQGSANPSSYSLELFCPVNKGEQFIIAYNAGGAVNRFRFYYAVGEGEN